MKKLCILLIVFILSGCGGGTSQMDRAIAFREGMLRSNGCSYTAQVTADFGDKTYTFTLACQGRNDGSLWFSVVKPETISGICGILSADGGKITFDEDKAVAFPLLAEGEASPISAPWILYNALRGGYIVACAAEGETLRITLNDSYEENALQVEVWMDTQERPIVAEILWEGRRILTINVIDFQML